MGYGEYSYLTDKTKGHVQQYYVDKFRIVSDLARGVPLYAGVPMLGRGIMGGVEVPVEGIKQEFDPALPTSDEPTAPDPRLVEASGSLYPWDPNYVDPEWRGDTFADLSDEEITDLSFQQFRSSLAEERGKALTAMDFGANARIQRIKEGVDETELLTLDGALDVNYARLQKISNPPTLSPTGTPQTNIPGFPYMASVGAMDFIEKPNEKLAFWKGPEPAELPYKKPSGADTPELPYNTSPDVSEIQQGQAARGLMPGSE